MKQVELRPIKTGVIKPGDSLTDAILEGLKREGLKLMDGDVLLIASKAVSAAEGAFVKLSDVSPSLEAKRLAGEVGLDERHVELILKHSEKIYGKVHKAFLTLKNNFLIANAGIDSSNAREGEVVLWPKNPQETAEKIMRELFERTGKRVAVVVVDSRTAPLRRGTVGLALGAAGFRPVKDYRGRRDLFGKPLQITLQNLADDLACAAHLLMGEADEGVPAVLARGAPIELDWGADVNVAFIRPEECLYMRALKKCC